MKNITYLISANQVMPTYSVLDSTFCHKQCHVLIRGFGTLIPILTYLPLPELVNFVIFKDFILTNEYV